MALTKDAILDADDKEVEEVRVPEWATDGDDTVYVRSLTGQTRDEFVQACLDRSRSDDPRDVNVQGMEGLLLTKTMCADPEGEELLFDKDDVEALRQKSGKALERVAKVARRLSGLTEDAIEDLAKN